MVVAVFSHPALGGKFWLWHYRFDGTEKNMMFGKYPLVGSKGARELHFVAKKLLSHALVRCVPRSRALKVRVDVLSW